ncbi:MAG: hypothetical protein NUV80_05690 [Candidatus Berkelbacteria bacterium]|nr:hypothetical protein [Candidatus Berkelbacteria bacterium]
MSTLSNISKNSGTFSNIGKESLIGYLLTDDLSYILAGSAEDETILIKEADVLVNATKNSGSLTSISKN